jgi:hypothetical protein
MPESSQINYTDPCCPRSNAAGSIPPHGDQARGIPPIPCNKQSAIPTYTPCLTFGTWNYSPCDPMLSPAAKHHLPNTAGLWLSARAVRQPEPGYTISSHSTIIRQPCAPKPAHACPMFTVAPKLYDHRERAATLAWENIEMEHWCRRPSSRPLCPAIPLMILQGISHDLLYEPHP